MTATLRCILLAFSLESGVNAMFLSRHAYSLSFEAEALVACSLVVVIVAHQMQRRLFCFARPTLLAIEEVLIASPLSLGFLWLSSLIFGYRPHGPDGWFYLIETAFTETGPCFALGGALLAIGQGSPTHREPPPR